MEFKFAFLLFVYLLRSFVQISGTEEAEERQKIKAQKESGVAQRSCQRNRRWGRGNLRGSSDIEA